MGAIVEDDVEAEAETDAAPRAERRRFVFWIVRYLPAEIVGTAAMLMAGLAVTAWTANPALIAIAAVLGESIGFYAVLAVTIFLEVSPRSRTLRRAALRTGMLLVAEFGVAELLDTFVIRPAALVLGAWLITDPLWGLLAGKIVADVVFYAVAAGAFTLTARWGLRGSSSERVS
jgi:hypothetical protein